MSYSPARRRQKKNPVTILLLIIIILGGIFYFYNKSKKEGKLDNIINKARKLTKQKEKIKSHKKPIKEVLIPFAGYMGKLYMNDGLKPNINSRFTKEFGINVELIIEENLEKSLDLFINDEVDIHWYTVDAAPTIYGSLAEHDIVCFGLIDWSRGGDVAVARKNIKSFNDIKGKTIAWVPKSPSHTAGLALLNAANLSIDDVNVKEVETPMEAAHTFINNKSHVSMVWAPDNIGCRRKVKGSHDLFSTRHGRHIIADCIMIKKDTYLSNKEKYDNYLAGILYGNAELNCSLSKRKKAAKLASQHWCGTSQTWLNALKTVRLCTYGDNINFFGLNPLYNGNVSGKTLYTKSARLYSEAGVEVEGSWDLFGYSKPINRLNKDLFSGSKHKAEREKKFYKRDKEQMIKKRGLAKNTINIKFNINSAKLSNTAKNVLNKKVLPSLQSFSGMYIIIEGHTDTDGDENANMLLSEKRAQSVKDFFIKTHNMPEDRFTAVGYGETKPKATKRASRRVVIKLMK